MMCNKKQRKIIFWQRKNNIKNFSLFLFKFMFFFLTKINFPQFNYSDFFVLYRACK